MGPKNIERNRRDGTTETVDGVDFSEIKENTSLPGNWRSFLSNRRQKRLLVNFLSSHFLKLAASQQLSCKACYLFITSGGFDDIRKDQAICAFRGAEVEYVLASGNHEEGDSRVWLHANATTCTQVLLYSPDSDTFFIGLPLVKFMYGKELVLLQKDTAYEKVFIHLNTFVYLLKSDPLLKYVDQHHLEESLQMLFIVSGCDFISFFRGFSKKTFWEMFRCKASFIAGAQSCGELWETGDSGLLSFFRLIGSLYFSKHRPAFLPTFDTSEAFLKSFSVLSNSMDQHVAFLAGIREKIWDRVISEVDFLPSTDALKLHWKRSEWVRLLWRQASEQYVFWPDPLIFGWEMSDSQLNVTWDSAGNFKKVQARVEWFTKGCGCQTGCLTKRCKCRKYQDPNTGETVGRLCGPGCSCCNCKNNGETPVDSTIDDPPIENDIFNDIDIYVL